MSMLAGRRQKQKVINLRAKNNAWSNDKNKFGQKMLEKMGWSEGKGLGANENGIVEHVVAKYKNDDKGLGYEDRNDQWTKHEDDFNALLANLSNSTSNDDLVPSGISLEKKSKKSKARIHYQKYTRGKDLSRYSDKDLANIFGKKSLKNSKINEEPSPKEEDIQSEQVFTDKGSMDDYFKNKLAALKTRGKFSTQQDTADQCIPDYAFQGFSDTSNNVENSENTINNLDYGRFTIGKSSNTTSDSPNSDQLEIKPKKKKKPKHEDQLPIENKDSEILDSKFNNTNDIDGNDTPIYKLPHGKCKKKKSKKSCQEFDTPGKNLEQELVIIQEQSKTCTSFIERNEFEPIKKKKRINNIENWEADQNHEQLQKVKRKKKK